MYKMCFCLWEEFSEIRRLWAWFHISAQEKIARVAQPGCPNTVISQVNCMQMTISFNLNLSKVEILFQFKIFYIIMDNMKWTLLQNSISQSFHLSCFSVFYRQNIKCLLRKYAGSWIPTSCRWEFLCTCDNLENRAEKKNSFANPSLDGTMVLLLAC